MELPDFTDFSSTSASCRTARGVSRPVCPYWTAVILLICSCLLLTEVSGTVEIVSPEGDSVTVTVGQILTIRCVATDGEIIRWSTGGMTISEKDRTILETLDQNTGVRTSDLTIQVYEVDGGTYLCFNPDYFEKDEIELIIQTQPTEGRVRIVDPDSDELRATQGGSFTLKCIGEEGSDLTWFHNGNPLRSTGSRVIITSSIDVEDQRTISLITRHSVNLQDAGGYQCKDGHDFFSADEVRVSVSETPKDTVPVTLVKPSGSSMVVPPGSAFTLQCRGDKRADLTWFINGTLISLLTTEPVVSLMDEAGTPDKISLLTVDIATYDDTGVYSCQNGLNMDDKDEIAVRIGHPETEAPVEVQAPTETRFTVLRVGSHMNLQCSLEAPGEHVTEWYKDDRKLTSDAKYVIKQATPTELKIQNTDRQDVGVYRCTFIRADTSEIVGNVIFNLTTSPCRYLTHPKNGSILHLPADPVYGDTASFQCDPGFKLTDKRTLVCDLRDGYGRYTWNRAKPRCLPLTGGEILQNVPTTLSPVLLRVGGQLKLQCSSGTSWTKAGKRLVNGEKYTIEKHSLIIKHTAKSDTGIYDCNIVDALDNTLVGIKKFNVTTLTCAKLPTLGNGSVDQCSTEPTYGETCVFRCGHGFKLSGSRSQTCEVAHEQSRAYWTGSEKPVCIRDARSKSSGYTGCAKSMGVPRTLSLLVPVVLLTMAR